MKRILFFALCAFSLFPVLADADSPVTVNQKLSAVLKRMMSRPVKSARVADNTWRPKQVKRYEWDNNQSENQWRLKQTDNYIWSAPDKPSELITTDAATGEKEKYVYTYNSDGKPVEKKGYILISEPDEWKYKEIENWEYDHVVHNFVVVNNVSVFTKDNGWAIADGYMNSIERNDDGNVVKQLRSEYENGDWEPIFVSQIVYGNDKKASSISLSEFDSENQENTITPMFTLKNITWITTDGQFMFDDVADNSMSILMGANKASKVTVVIYEEGELFMEVPMNVTYTDDSLTATGTATYQGFPLEMTLKMTELPYGGARFDALISVNFGFFSHKQMITSVEEYNEWGMCILKETIQSDAYSTTVEEREEYDVEYNADGYPSLGILRVYSESDNKMVPVSKDEYEEYSPSGVNGLVAPEDMSETYFTLQGLKISKPTVPGVYIHRHNGRTTKILVP